MKNVGIGLLPSSPDSDALIDLSALLHKLLGFVWCLNATDNYPHLSVLHLLNLSEDEFAKVNEIFDIVARRSLPDGLHHLIPTQVSYVERGWYFLDVATSPTLRLLHSVVFDSLQSFLRPQLTTRDVSYLSPEERKSFEMYGYRYVGKAFRPHITLGRLLDSADSNSDGDRHERNLEKLISKSNIPSRIHIEDFALFELGTDGICSRVLSRVGI